MSTAAPTVKTRILCISDTHSGRYSHVWSDSGGFRPPFPKADVLIHSGDLSMTGKPQEYQEALDMLATFDAELKLVIAGNHDLSLDEKYYMSMARPGGSDMFGYQFDEDAALMARQIWTGSKAKEAGVTYLDEGIHHFELSNGAKFSVYASPWQPEFFNWAFNYPHDEDRWNPASLIKDGETCKKTGKKFKPAPPEQDPHPIPEGENVDVMITHGPAWMHLDETKNGTKAGCPHLLRALERVRPKLHVSGHIHEGWGCEVVQWGKGQGDAVGPTGEATKTVGMAKGHYEEDIIRPSDESVADLRSAFVDVSSGSARPLKAGDETVLVNASIVNIKYRAKYAPWLIDLDLPSR